MRENNFCFRGNGTDEGAAIAPGKSIPSPTPTPPPTPRSDVTAKPRGSLEGELAAGSLADSWNSAKALVVQLLESVP